ncbi:MAG: FAD-dependent monooxygenase [Deltaproteobacteria bacterium]|nr:FAD-dependent monooxygenase [Deltaproteobacteria bacterium]
MLPVQIIGAGVAGLALARALRLRGVHAQVHERAPHLRAEGGVLTLWSNGVGALGALGIDPLRDRRAIHLERATLWSSRGERLADIPVGDLGRRLGSPSVVVRRSELLALLAEGLPPEDLTLGVTVDALRHTDLGAEVRFTAGSVASGRAVVGADGLHSVVRSCLVGEEPPRAANQDCWLGVVQGDPGDGPPEGTTFGVVGQGRRFWLANAGRGELHWYAIVGGERRSAARDQGSLAEAFHRWPHGAEALILATPAESLRVVALHDRAPLHRWSEGCVTLAGDAAHACTPDLGQGACQSLESALVLAEALAEERSVPEALRRYELQRRTRAHLVQSLSRMVSDGSMPEDPVRCALRDLSCRLTPAARWVAALEPLLAPSGAPG